MLLRLTITDLILFTTFLLCNPLFSDTKDYSLDDLNAKFEKKEIVCVLYHETLTEDSKMVSSQVWKQFFRLLDTVTNILLLNYVFCKYCESFVHFNGKTTTPMVKHQRKCSAHSKEGQKRAKTNFDSADLVPLRDAAAKFVCIDFRPAYAVQGKGLCEYIYACIQLAKRYPNMNFADLLRALPSRNLVTSHIQSMASEAVVMVTQMLRNAINEYGCFGVTSDLWTDTMNSTPFITITVHLFMLSSSALQLKSLVIELCQMTCDRMTGVNIREAIINSFAPFGITNNHLLENTCFVTDRGANMLLATKEFESHACLAHLCNSVVGAMLGVPDVKKIVANASSLVRFVKQSHIGSQLTSKLKAHVETRWNSVYDMMNSIIDNHQDLFILLQTKDENQRLSNVLSKLTCLPMNEIKAICQLLVFFKHVTTAIEGDKYVTLHSYWPTILEMKRILKSNRNDTELVEAMKKAGREYIDRSENSGSFHVSHRHRMAVFLHPQMKGLSFASVDEKREIHSHVNELIDQQLRHKETAIEPSTSTSTTKSSMTSLFQGYFDNNNNVECDEDDNELERYIVCKVEMVMKN